MHYAYPVSSVRRIFGTRQGDLAITIKNSSPFPDPSDIRGSNQTQSFDNTSDWPLHNVT